MKKVVLIILVAMVPFITMAQKRVKNVSIEANEFSNNDFMIITIYEVSPVSKDLSDVKETRGKGRIKVVFDFGRAATDEKLSGITYKSMAQVINSATALGWEFIHSNVLLNGSTTVHYYYMKRKE